MKKVLVIGADGFLGRQLCNKLAHLGVEVSALVASGIDYSALEGFRGIKCIEFDFEMLEDLEEKNAFSKVDVLFHMAWAGVSSSAKNDYETQIKNISFGLKVLSFAVKHGIKRVIVPGSAAEYSCSSDVINGNNIPAPSDLYSATKIATHYICQTYALQHNIDFIWTAITSIYGPGRDDNNLISYTIKKLLKSEKPSFTKLEQQWDFLFIDDLIDALIALGEKGKGGKVYPIGSGKNHPIFDYINIIHNMINPDIPLGIGDLPYKSYKIDNQIMDITELKKDTGFEPKYSFNDGIKLTIDYFKNSYNV